jgi:hypothetical protein
MTEQERTLLKNFLNGLTEVRGLQKDTEADAMIRDTAAKQPDATYLLVQRALLLEQALNSAKSQLADLQHQLDAARASTGSFLGGAPAANGWFNTPPAAPQPPVYAQAAGNNQARPSYFSPGTSGFLGTAAAMAAGTVAGSFLFDGIESLLHHNGGAFTGNNDLAGNTTITNNYYGDNSEGISQEPNGDGLLDTADYDPNADAGYFDDGGDSSFI